VIFYLIYMPAAVDALFDGDRDNLFRALRGAPAEQQVRGERPKHSEAAELTALEPLLAEAERAMGPVSSLSIHNPGRSDARIEVRPVLG
ncbi:hypothetical protein O6461_25165, partial [Salmonella enterica subsp. enterica]